MPPNRIARLVPVRRTIDVLVRRHVRTRGSSTP